MVQRILRIGVGAILREVVGLVVLELVCGSLQEERCCRLARLGQCGWASQLTGQVLVQHGDMPCVYLHM